MSYDLCFWKQSQKCTQKPSDIYNLLLDAKEADGIDEIPIKEILLRIKNEFPDMYETPNQLIWQSEKDDSCFLLDWSYKHLSVEGHGVDSGIFNRIIDIMIEFDCYLYDPQTDTRYGEQ